MLETFENDETVNKYLAKTYGRVSRCWRRISEFTDRIMKVRLETADKAVSIEKRKKMVAAHIDEFRNGVNPTIMDYAKYEMALISFSNISFQEKLSERLNEESSNPFTDEQKEQINFLEDRYVKFMSAVAKNGRKKALEPSKKTILLIFKGLEEILLS